MEFSFLNVAAGSAIIFAAFFIRSLTGFGSALVSIPFLALLFDLKFAVPLESTLEVGFTLLLIRNVYQDISKRTLLPMIAGAVLGTLVGTYFLISLGDLLLKKVLGGFIILFGLYFLRGGSEMKNEIPARWGLPAGAAGGILGGLFGTSGPPYVMYLAYRLRKKEVLRASLIGMFAVDYTWRTGVFALSGLLTPDLLQFALLLLPALCLGALLGNKVHWRIGEKHFRKIVAGVLIVSGVLLLR